MKPWLRSPLPFACLLLGCSSDGGDASPNVAAPGASDTTGSTATGSGNTTSTGTPASVGTTAGTILLETSASNGTTSGGTGSGGMPETCDGIDNDENGIVDDVDAGGDGVCDCLSIATLGQIGPWSNGGNVFESWLDARTPLGAVELDDQVLTGELLSPFQVIVVLHVDTTEVSNANRTAAAHHVFSDEEQAAFRHWVEQGGGVMTTIGYTADEAAEVVNVNRLLGSIGMGYSPTNLDLTGYVEGWDAHPVTMGVSNIFTDNGVEPAGAAALTVARQQAQSALQVSEAGSGRVVVWGDEWITYDSEWADVEEQQVELFWLNILKWLSPPMTCQVPTPPEVIR